jgi:hypothetical protein
VEIMTPDQARAFLRAGFGRRNGVRGELLVRVTPTTIIGRDARAA